MLLHAPPRSFVDLQCISGASRVRFELLICALPATPPPAKAVGEPAGLLGDCFAISYCHRIASAVLRCGLAASSSARRRRHRLALRPVV